MFEKSSARSTRRVGAGQAALPSPRNPRVARLKAEAKGLPPPLEVQQGTINTDEDMLTFCHYIIELATLWEKTGTPPEPGGLLDQDPIEMRFCCVVFNTIAECEHRQIQALR